MQAKGHVLTFCHNIPNYKPIIERGTQEEGLEKDIIKDKDLGSN
jgi:hypothetical protein